ncbi:uncharacterized protein LOC117117978 [Anneissia japonica]|uniref:uncharacterized protein LOC117117978 n=1 Tax=Anneissia japonica TaxID=1529436 RepID=UPI001425B567|nr:uncharacterized protein LOC117117978 [Anneissia japonica]
MAAYSKDDYFLGSDLSDFEDELDELEPLEDSENECEDDNLCICGNVGTQKMIFCENPSCFVGWYHYECVGLTEHNIPTGAWFCGKGGRECASSIRNNSEETPTNSTTQTNLPTKSKEQPNNTTKTKGDKSGSPKKQKKGTKQKVLRPKSSFTKQMAVDKAVEIATAVLQGIPTKPIYRHQYPNAIEIRHICGLLLEKQNNVILTKFFKEIAGKLWDCLDEGRNKHFSTEEDNEVWRKFQLLKMHTIGVWQDLLMQITIQCNKIPANIVLQEFLLEFLKLLMLESNKVNDNDENIPSSLTLTRDEEEILRYTAGYVPHALLKRYLKLPNNTMAVAFATELAMWKVQEDIEECSFYKYTNSWIQRQNRGGLFIVNDKIFFLFREIEVEYQKNISAKTLANLKGLNINNILMGKFNQNRKVNRCWCEAVNGRLSDKLSFQLQQKVFMYWIKIRTKAFIKVTLDLQKKKNASVSRKGQKALRKNLTS